MAHDSPEFLLDAAKSRKLTAAERRLVLAHLEELGTSQSNYQLAALFGVDEKVIRKDRKELLQEYTKTISPEHALSFVASYLKSHDDLIRKTKFGLEKCLPGTLGHQNYLRLLSDLESKRMKLLQEIGAVPKELGHLNVSEERWVAVVSTDGVTSVRPDAGPWLDENEETVQ